MDFALPLLCGILLIVFASSSPIGRSLASQVDLPVAAAVFIAASVSSVAGFAFSAIAASLLLHIVPDPIEAVRIMLVSSIALQSYSVLFIWRSIRIVPLAQALAGGLAFVPVGAYLLLHTPSEIYRAALGCFIIAYCVIAMLLPKTFNVPYNGTGRFIVGCLAGIIGPATAFPGAIPTLWVSLTDLPKDLQRGFFQPFILAMQVASLAALSAVVPVQAPSEQTLGYVVPAMFGAHLGLSIFRRLSGAQFTLAVRTFLFLAALSLIAQAIAPRLLL